MLGYGADLKAATLPLFLGSISKKKDCSIRVFEIAMLGNSELADSHRF